MSGLQSLEDFRKVYTGDKEVFDKIEEYTEKKLYFELGQACLSVAESASRAELPLISFFDFVRDTEGQIDPIHLVKIADLVSKSIQGGDQRLDFLESLVPALENSKSEDAYVIWLASKAAAHALGKRDFYACRGVLDEAEKKMNTSGFCQRVSAESHSAFYKSQAMMHKLKGDLDLFYRSMLDYLAYTPLESISPNEMQDIAFEVGLTSLLAPNEYNFGELLLQPLMLHENVKGMWILKLVEAFHEGNFSAYDAALKEFKSSIDSDPRCQGLRAAVKDNTLRQKMSAMALAELAFKKPKKERVLGFESIAAQCRLSDKGDVELLVMKAMSRGLIRGTIDQVEQVVRIQWVKPRVLDKARLDLLKFRVDGWAGMAASMVTQMEEQTTELLVA